MGERDRRNGKSREGSAGGGGEREEGATGGLPRLLVDRLGPAAARVVVQRRQRRARQADDPAAVQAAATAGTRGEGAPLPHLDQIQRSFGRHDVSHIRAHTDEAAQQGAAAMGAEAFAAGDEVAFAGAPSLHTAAHEAAHVIQQRGGVQLKGGVGQAGDPHERHADAVADRVVAGESSEALLDQYAGTSAGGAPAVQRKIGFEFETGWLVSEDGHAIKKAGRVGTQDHAGFKVEADEAGGGQSEIEFIVHPPVEESVANLGTLADIMAQISVYGNNLRAQAANGPFTLDQATGVGGDARFRVQPGDAELAAGPQITLGIDLAKIAVAATHNQAGQEATGELAAFVKDNLETPAGKIQGNLNGDPQPPSPRLLGLLTLIRSYIKNARIAPELREELARSPDLRHAYALNYPKRIADAMLARTDFAKMFSMLPDQERARFAANHDEWLNLVVRALADLGFTAEELDADLIERQIQVDEENPNKGTRPVKDPSWFSFGKSLTRRSWLLGMVEGQDKLAKIKDHESLGALGNKTEQVGPQLNVEAAIMEIRGLQTKKIPLREWSHLALSAFRYILALHDHQLPAKQQPNH